MHSGLRLGIGDSAGAALSLARAYVPNPVYLGTSRGIWGNLDQGLDIAESLDTLKYPSFPE